MAEDRAPSLGFVLCLLALNGSVLCDSTVAQTPSHAWIQTRTSGKYRYCMCRSLRLVPTGWLPASLGTGKEDLDAGLCLYNIGPPPR